MTLYEGNATLWLLRKRCEYLKPTAISKKQSCGSVSHLSICTYKNNVGLGPFLLLSWTKFTVPKRIRLGEQVHLNFSPCIFPNDEYLHCCLTWTVLKSERVLKVELCHSVTLVERWFLLYFMWLYPFVSNPCVVHAVFMNSGNCSHAERKGHWTEWQRIMLICGNLGGKVGFSLGQDWKTVVTSYLKPVGSYFTDFFFPCSIFLNQKVIPQKQKRLL